VGKLPFRPLLLKIIVAASIVFILMLPLFVYLVRSPVLIVADVSSIPLYGETRIRNETKKASLALFRKVKVVIIADNASNEIIRFAVSEASSHPYCIIFPLRFLYASHLYYENNPQVSVVLLAGRYNKETAFPLINGDQNNYYIYKTDIEDEFHRAAIAVAAIDMGKNGKIAVFLDQNVQQQAMNTFLQTINGLETPLETVFFSSFSQFFEIPDLSCAILAGTGIEFLENNQGIPVIFHTWVDPSLIPDNVVIMVDDSPWAQTIQAVRMVNASVVNGQIKSKFIINKKNIDKQTLRKLKK
jgi:hypothetical protein